MKKETTNKQKNNDNNNNKWDNIRSPPFVVKIITPPSDTVILTSAIHVIGAYLPHSSCFAVTVNGKNSSSLHAVT